MNEKARPEPLAWAKAHRPQATWEQLALASESGR
jgi:hypothetical protein